MLKSGGDRQHRVKRKKEMETSVENWGICWDITAISCLFYIRV